MKKNILLLAVCSFISFTTIGQTKEEIKKITANYDLVKLKAKEVFLKNKAKVEKEKAIAMAKEKNWPLTIDKNDGGFMELIRVTRDGFPIYYSTDNVAAARSTRTNFLNSGGALGLNLNGQGMTVRVWDGGNVRDTHTAFGGRVTVVDNTNSASTNIFHATHVTGTMIASANPSNIKGMAPSANARTFDWFSDEAEAVSEAMDGMLISNHSYGVPINGSGTPLPPEFIGSYSFDAFTWDDIAYDAPYYLPVMSAGNDGQTSANSEPILAGYDKLTSNKTAKNILTVANCQDVLINTSGGIVGNVVINPGSSQGPTDDFRVKPDITGNGTDLISTSNNSNTATGSASGTSMSSPNVAGSLILLQQHYKNLYNNFMRASTLKGLACHTADDAGLVGPDAIFGWGLLNCKRAAETLSNNGLSSWVSEENLNSGQTYTMTVTASGGTPLVASICWTDLPGQPYNGGLGANLSTPVLVNDLDIRITRNNVVSFPWRMNSNPSQASTQNQDNEVDNVEQVRISNPVAGAQYIITVSSKRALVNDAQKYALIVTGLSSSIAINSTSDNLQLCSDQNAVYTFSYTQAPTSSGVTTFSAVDLPVGATATFSPPSLSSNGTVTMTVSGLNNVAPNEYFVGIRATNSTEIETRYKGLKIFNPIFTPVVLESPTNDQLGLSTSVVLKWSSQPNAMNYIVQVSDSSSFSNLIVDEIVTNNEYNVAGLNQASRYYWRVIPDNSCGDANSSQATIFSFVTGILTCDLTFTADDFSNAFIDTIPNSVASVPLTITGGHLIGDLDVNVDITHTWIGDIEVTLQGPASIGSPIIMLLDQPCGDRQNIDCTIDDDGNAPTCSGNPSVSGNIAPVNPLSALNTLPADGEWILKVVDNFNEDGGTINQFSIDLCRISTFLSTVENPIQNTTIFPNPSKGIVNVSIPELNGQANIHLFDMQGRKVISQTTNQVYTTLALDHLQNGIYLITVENDFGSISKKIIVRKN